MKEYRVKVTVRNNLLLSAIEDAGYKSQSDFARSCDLSLSAINNLVGLRQAPLNSYGEFTEMAKIIMEVLGACPTDLWTEEQLTMELRSNTAEKNVDKQAMMAVLSHETFENLIEFSNPEKQLEEKQMKEKLHEVVDSLTPREKKVIVLRHGIDTDEYNLREISEIMDKTKERVRQIEQKAMRKLKHASRKNQLNDVYTSSGIKVIEPNPEGEFYE